VDAFARGLRALTGRRHPIALLAGTVATWLLALSLAYLQADPRLWVRAEGAGSRVERAPIESQRRTRALKAGAEPALSATLARMIIGRVFLAALLLVSGACLGGDEVRANASYDERAAQPAQRALIDEQLSRFVVEPAPPARVFFLGFAGYGEQKVFAEEIKLAAQRVGERYGSTTRTLLLINDRRDLTTSPLATHDNLRYALRELARRMNPETDVLFLVLSSHGASNGLIEVSNTGMEPLGLGPASLDLLTREAGIRMRVIVVSACFSGAFVKPLANNETIVLTAASKSRSSFGCSDDRHLTWFGEAFFQDSLPGAPTLREAFDTTRELVRSRERALHARASQPQSYFGPVVESRLAEIEAARRQ
jgi:hypothetical protein